MDHLFGAQFRKGQCDNGWIALWGEVEWAYLRQSAEDAVRYLTGVNRVSDEITIKPKVSSYAVKSEIEAALKRRAHAGTHQLQVEVNDPDVTLTGSVHSWSEREIAASSAWASPVVRNVMDHITIAY